MVINDNTDNIALAINDPASDKGGKSTMETIEINNRDLNGDEDKDNIDNYSVAPTLCHGRGTTI